MELQNDCGREAVISLEWTVPYGPAYFHLGVHNLPPGRARELMARLQAYTTFPDDRRLLELRDALDRIPDVLLVLNHPFWEMEPIGESAVRKMLESFIQKYGSYIHAFEVSGLRPWRENELVLQMAESRGLPVVSGGDRHGREPSTMLNLSRARNFSEFAAEIREDRTSEIVVMPGYEEPFGLRMMQVAWDVLREYPSHPCGRAHWTDRVFFECDDSEVRPLSRCFQNGEPNELRLLTAAMRLIEAHPLARGIARGLEPARNLRHASAGSPDPANCRASRILEHRGERRMNPPRVALFTDSFHEVNGAAYTFRQYRDFAQRQGLPVLMVHSGAETRCFERGSITTLELKRSRATFAVDVDFGFDPLLWRHWSRIRAVLASFQPDLVHIISPGDFSVLGAIAAHRSRIPIMASFHTNLHQFASARLQNTLHFLPARPRQAVCRAVEAVCRKGLAKYYEIPRLILAPNPEVQEWLEAATRRPCRIMRRGVDIDLFRPSRRDRENGIFRLGYVGRLMREKNLRLLAELERVLNNAGHTQYQFVIVGHGGERAWLEQNLFRAEFTGVLRGEELARTYANMDLFVFRSRTDAFGNVVQEALAAGTPVVVTAQGGPKYLIESGVTGYVAETTTTSSKGRFR